MPNKQALLEVLIQTKQPSQRRSSTLAAASARRPLSHAQAISCEHLPAISGGGGGSSASQRRAHELLDPARPSSGEAVAAAATATAGDESEKRPHRCAADRTGLKWRTHLAPALGLEGRADANADALDSLAMSGHSFGSDENINDNDNENYASSEAHAFARAPFHVVDRVKEKAASPDAHAPRRGSLSTADLRPTETAHSASINPFLA